MSKGIRQSFQRFQNGAFVLGAGAIVVSLIGAAFDPRQFFASYLFGYFFWLGLGLGCFLLTMIHHLTGGRWGFCVRRFLEAGAATVPLMAVLFVPLLFGLKELYPWARADEIAYDAVLQKRAAYMNTGWFIARSVICLVLWSAMAWCLRQWSLEQDETRELRRSRQLRIMSGPGVLIFPLTATFVFADWIMSLESEWYSTMFTIIIIAGQIVAALAFATVLLRIFENEEPISEAARTEVYHQLGNLLLTFVLFWTYVSFSQLLIIYSTNLPQEINWYLRRITGGWLYVVALIAATHFFIPLCLLLFRAIKRNPTFLTAIAVCLLVAHTIAVYWLIVPSFHKGGVEMSWLDFTALVGLGGVWLGAFAWLMTGTPLLPRNDPRMEEELAYEPI